VTLLTHVLHWAPSASSVALERRAAETSEISSSARRGSRDWTHDGESNHQTWHCPRRREPIPS
jgi:hypothetical protein